MSLFLISAIRAIVEMLGLCMLGQGFLYLIAGPKRAGNRVYQLFDLITKPPRLMLAIILPRSAGDVTIGIFSFVVVLILWLGLALARKFV